MTLRSVAADNRPAIWLDRRTPPHVVTLVLMTGVSALNMNMVLPSLPSLAAYYAADYAVVSLTVSAYLGLTAALQLIIGPLSDRYGRRPVLLGCFAVFLVATLGCMVAPNIETFLAFRMMQATVASAFALSRAIVRDMVGPNEAASMIGYVTMGMSVAPMISPMIGGFLDETLGWQSVFGFTFIAGAVALTLMWFDMGETNAAPSTNFAAQFRAYPELFRSPRFWGYSLTAALASGAFFAFLGGGPWVASEILGMGPAQLGFYFGFIALGYLFGNFLSGRYTARVGLNRMMLLGGIVASAGMILALLLFAAGVATPLSFFGSILFLGLGNGLCLPSANAGIVSVRPHLAGSASGLGGALMIGGGA
ncbi:MAG: multidrug effflux MFS transporter, partial [Rhodobacteraceae bacterium]|nr:multidrug effflux MFS transporter [Paracoccaceae bacterium]